MVSLGLDLSLTSTGVIQLEEGKIIGRQVLKSLKRGDKPIDDLRRLIDLREDIRHLIKHYNVDVAVVEGLAFLARNTQALTQLAGLNYMVKEMLAEMKIPFYIVAPSALKKFITGKGNCAKELMLLETYKRYGESFSDDNLCDAYGLAKIGEAIITKDIKLTKPQEEVVKLVQKQL